MKMIKSITFLIIVLAFGFNLQAQNAGVLTQTIRGQVIDKESNVTLPGATVVVLETYF